MSSDEGNTDGMMELSRSDPQNFLFKSEINQQRSGMEAYNPKTTEDKIGNSSLIKWSNLPPYNNQFTLNSPQGIPAELDKIKIDTSNGFNTKRDENITDNELLKLEIGKVKNDYGMKNHQWNQEMTRIKLNHGREKEAIHNHYAFANPMLAKDENYLNSKYYFVIFMRKIY